jgi:hypothetical protein
MRGMVIELSVVEQLLGNNHGISAHLIVQGAVSQRFSFF